MQKLLQSKIAAWFALIIIILVIIFTFSLRAVWWAFFDEFFAFMAVFCQLTAVYSFTKLPFVAKKLQIIAAWCLGLAILSFIVEYIFWQIYP